MCIEHLTNGLVTFGTHNVDAWHVHKTKGQQIVKWHMPHPYPHS
jgi:hypothetical protein